MPRQTPDLGLEEVSNRVDRRRVVRMPGEIAEQPLGLVAGTERQSLVGRGEVEQGDHAGPGHDVAQASRFHRFSSARGGALDRTGQCIYGWADVHRSAWNI